MVFPDLADTRIFRVALPVPMPGLFDYLASADQPGQPGMRVQVPFGNSGKIGVVMEIAATSDLASEKLKPITKLLDERPLLSADDLALLNWVAGYYHHPLGLVVSLALPAGLRQGKVAALPAARVYALTEAGQTLAPAALKRAPQQQAWLEKFQAHGGAWPEAALAAHHANWRKPVQALLDKGLLQLSVPAPAAVSSAYPPAGLAGNADQLAAIAAITANLDAFRVFLLDGVTGSGKTEVYMQVIAEVLAQVRQVLVLVPEITLTPQLEARFRGRFTVAIAVSHSKLTDAQRQTAWLQMHQGEAAILLGTRSALFTPCPRLGLIILDEEHDASFKQQDGLRFSARDVAVVRGKQQNIPVVLGSATPSLESLHNSQTGRYQWLRLPKRAGVALPPSLQVLDIRNQRLQEGLSEALLAAVQETLAAGGQVLLFLNRRGFAPTLICHACAWVARCRRCDANLVIHRHEHCLRCHHCGAEQALPPQCPACKVGPLTALGLGTERVEAALTELFPKHTVLRLDKDTTQRKGALETYLAQINSGGADIILGTQMLAKGHHFANVTLVAIVDVDSGLFSIDFHAAERLAQLLVQVSGRAGRAEKPGKVLLQTRRPDHPLLLALLQTGYHGFAQTALAERKAAELPPFGYQALLRADGKDPAAPKAFLSNVVAQLRSAVGSNVQVLGPVSAPMARRAGWHRYQVLLQSRSRQRLHQALDVLTTKIATQKSRHKLRWSLDVDPVDLY